MEAASQPMAETGPASAFAIICIGLVSGFGGGVLLGRTAVTTLHALELLTDDHLLMNQLESYIINTDQGPGASWRHAPTEKTSNDHVFNMRISVLTEEFGFFSSIFSFSVGIFAGLLVYELVVRKHGETERGKALALAGPVCLMGVTATGLLLGFGLHRFLIFTSRFHLIVWFLISIFSMLLFLLTLPIFDIIGHRINIMFAFLVYFFPPLNVPVVFLFVFLIAFFLKTKLILLGALTPILVFGKLLEDKVDLQLSTHHILLMLMITDVFNFGRWPVVTLVSLTPTSNAVLEGLFIGVLTSQLLMVAFGMSLLVSCQMGGAGKFCAGAIASGVACIGVIESVRPLLGMGPTIGALLGVAGTVGVTLAAAGAVTDSYGTVVGRYGLVGRLGVTVGAAVGACLSSWSHSGLSSTFMALCAASIPTGLYLRPMVLFLLRYDCGWKLNLCVCVVTITFGYILSAFGLYFICTQAGFFLLLYLVVTGLMMTCVIVCLTWFVQYSHQKQSVSTEPLRTVGGT